MVNEDIHTIWRIWGDGGLIDKLGPDRTIRELKKRCDAGAIIGCSLYKLLIEKWIDVATGAKDPGQRGPAEDFMSSAGEEELVKKIEDLHVQYPNGIPRSIRMDVKDEWDAALEKKVGRRIPLDPKDASKKDIEESKRIAQELMAKEMPRPLKPLYKPPPEKEEKPKPAAPPRAAAPEEVPPRPLIVKGPPELELMKKEIEDKIAEEKRRRARGGGMAGEPEGDYTDRQKKRDYQDGYERTKFCFEEVLKTGRACPTSYYYGAYAGAIADLIRGKKDIPQVKVDALKTTILKLHSGSEFYRGVYDFLIEKIQEYKKAKPKGEVRDTGGDYQDYQVLATLPGGVANWIKTQKLVERLKGMGITVDVEFQYFEDYQPKSFGDAPELIVSSVIRVPAEQYDKANFFLADFMKQAGFEPTARDETEIIKETQDVYSKWTYDDFKEIINRTINIEDLIELAKHIDESGAMTPGDKVSVRQLAEKRKRLIESGAPELRKQIEEQDRELKLATASRLRDDDKKKDDDVMQEPPDYTQWTFTDFEGLIPGLADPEDLEELQEYIDASDKLMESEAETLRNLIRERIKEVEGGS